MRVFIIHCKEDLRGTFSKPINQVIADQTRGLLEEQGLGVEIIAAEQGMHIRTFVSYHIVSYFVLFRVHSNLTHHSSLFRCLMNAFD